VRLVFVTQQVDPSSPVLGATVAKIRSLAALVDEVAVLADTGVEGVLPENCRIRRFHSGTRAGRGLRFEAALARELSRRPRPDAVVAHMCPIYAVLAAPAARPLSVRVLLWFTHWRRSRLLALAERLSSAVVTVEERTFPLPSRKLVAIGHGIDLGAYPCTEPTSHDGLRLVALGRLSPAKGLDTVLRAVSLVPGVRLDVHGPTLTPEERACRESLRRLVSELALEDRVVLGAPVPHEEVPRVLSEADALVNNMRGGATDKVVFEAAAACRPVLASNPALDGFLPGQLRFPREDAAALADRIRRLLDADRRSLGRELRSRVAREHSVEGWAARVVEVAGG
jgi:glycosyltransferase involved in cell wall biosynthesis